MKTFGKATYRRGKLYFDAVGWAMIKAVAKRTHRSPTRIVNAALRRGFRIEKSKNTGK
jgi:hypothetical protein